MFIERRTSRGHTYLWLTHKGRVNGKSVRIFSKYLCPEDALLEHIENIELTIKPETKIFSYDFGLPVVLMSFAERLDLINIINKCTFKRDQGLTVGSYMVIAALQRCINPQSKVHIKKWYNSTYLRYMFPEITTYLDSLAYTNHYPYLTKDSMELIETEIAKKLKEEFKVEMKELFFDPTNFFTYTNPGRENQKLFGHGHSKEGRHTLNLINLSLVCTRDGGIPIIHCTYPGGTADAVHFKKQYPKILTRLRKLKASNSTVTLVFDKGNISPEVFQAFDDSEIYWVCSVRPSTQKEFKNLSWDDFPIFELPNKKEIGILEFERPMFSESAIKKSSVPDYENPDRRLIVQYNPERARWNEKNLIRKLQARIDKINKYFKGPDKRLENTKKYWKWKKKSAVETKIKNIITENEKEEYLNYIGYKMKQIRNTNEKDLKIQYEIGIKENALQEYVKTLGKSYYMTNHPTMSKVDIIWLYRQQFNVERAFKYLKHPDLIRIRPMWVYTDDSVQGFNFTCILGLLLLTLLTREVNKSFPELGLFTIKDLLSEIKLAEIEFTGYGKKIRKIFENSPEAQKLLDFFELENII
ncbi:MAG: IS1634 family transposase [Candidatus Lokiarchaeota archaeon]|nr:IS1634 family transposase [Candidatus Lokiarchaeota archaeon]